VYDVLTRNSVLVRVKEVGKGSERKVRADSQLVQKGVWAVVGPTEEKPFRQKTPDCKDQETE
jgi:hypothetical protein